MRSGETLYYLEMRSPSDLQAAASGPTDLALTEVHSHHRIRSITTAIGRPLDWPTQHWSDERWDAYLRRSDLRHWLARWQGEVVGLVSLRFAPDEVEIDTFGLLPEHVGRGLGADLLCRVVRLAWNQAPSARRVWLHTSSADHPSALPNYQRRGFRLYAQVPPEQQAVQRDED